MTQDPWRKAYRLSRSRTPEGAQPGTRTGKALPPHLRPRRAVWPWVTLVLLAFGGGGYYLWTQRGVLIPKYADELPKPAAEAVERTPLPIQELDIAAMDGGLGIGLSIGGDYLNLVGATRDWGVEWKLNSGGDAPTRLTAPGLVVHAQSGKLRGYKLDIKQVFADEHWQSWRKALSDAGISPELNWRTLTGEATMPPGVTEKVVTGRGGLRFAGEGATTSYSLIFRDGWLIRIEAGLSTGEPVPDPIFEPPPGSAAPAPPMPPDAAPPGAPVVPPGTPPTAPPGAG